MHQIGTHTREAFGSTDTQTIRLRFQIRNHNHTLAEEHLSDHIFFVVSQTARNIISLVAFIEASLEKKRHAPISLEKAQ